MATHRNLQLIKQWAALNTSHEIEKLLDLFTPDAIYEDVPLEIVTRSRAELRGLFEATYNAAPDWKATIVSAMADDEHGAAEWVMSGTHLGDFPGFPKSGRSLSVRAAAIVRFKNGGISRWTDFWSLSTFKQQLGFE